jgi:hypothetical protein
MVGGNDNDEVYRKETVSCEVDKIHVAQNKECSNEPL